MPVGGVQNHTEGMAFIARVVAMRLGAVTVPSAVAQKGR